MTQEYAIWKPEHDGHAPPNWRDGMRRNFFSISRGVWLAVSLYDKSWRTHHKYQVPAEALNSPNDDAQLGVSSQVEMAIELVTRQPPEVLARYGITLEPKKDWATELWADLFAVRGMDASAELIRECRHDSHDRKAIELLRTRFEQMIAERSITNDQD